MSFPRQQNDTVKSKYCDKNDAVKKKRKQFFLGITVAKIMDKVNFAVTFGVFAHPPNRKVVLGGKGGGGGVKEQSTFKFQNSAIKHR